MHMYTYTHTCNTKGAGSEGEGGGGWEAGKEAWRSHAGGAGRDTHTALEVAAAVAQALCGTANMEQGGGDFGLTGW